MTTIATKRLHQQRLVKDFFQNPEDVVQWFGAVQAQEYAAAKWALALRMSNITDAQVEQAIADGAILRTHVMRPTWHFVIPADLRWLLELTGPRVKAAMASYFRQVGLDDATLSQTNRLLAAALESGKHLTRAELGSMLEQAGISTPNLRLSFILSYAELDRVVCSGARRGKQQTYALFDERVPPTTVLKREEALAKLTQRYFTSHGPATVQDFSWWSGLTVADAKAGIEMVKSELIQEVIDGKTYWFSPELQTEPPGSPIVHLLPPYDEYLVGYKDRSAVYDQKYNQQLSFSDNPLDHYTIAIDGQIAGTWTRMIKKSTLLIEFSPFQPLTNAEVEAIHAAAEKYGKFLGLDVKLP
jgi:hypothetical protein